MDSKKLPLWKMALLADPGSFGAMPANFTPGLPLARKNVAEDKSAKNEEKKEKLMLDYAAVKTQFCVDSNLAFSGSLATAYFRAMKNKGEKIFLQGNVFLAKLAKAVLEKNGNLFAETCEACKDENYFLECAKALEEQGFLFEKGGKLNKDSWLCLFEIVSLLTEEYLSTKCDLPSLKTVECKENSENSSDLKIIFAPESTDEDFLREVALLPLESVPCSSDFLSIGADFFSFLDENFPYKNNEYELENFLKKIFDENVCKNLNPLPVPDSFATSVMEACKLGAYKDKKIYINHRLALDSLRNPESRFVLLLTLLHEYGHFLDDVLHERAGIKGDSKGEEGKGFASRFMEYSAGDLFNKDFKFADFVVPDAKGEDLKFSLGISDLSYEDRKGIWCIFEYGEDLGNGSLKLPSGEVVEDAEFFGLADMPNIAVNLYNSRNRTHQKLTIAGAEAEKIKTNNYSGRLLVDGSIWPDFPTVEYLDTNIPYALFVLTTGKDISRKKLAYESHYGGNQHWHSMCPKAAKIQTNAEIRNIILYEAEKWYSEAIKKKKENKIGESLFALGKLCHMVQDSFVLSHSWRRYAGDEKFIEENKIEKKDNGKIWTFQDYKAQDGSYHAWADCPTQKFNIQTIGYKSAENATKEIMARYARNLAWHERYSAIGPLKNYFSKIYEICSVRENLPSGGSHPWFKKDNTFSREQIQDFLTRFSMEIEE